jgi:hypothetical protein
MNEMGGETGKVAFSKMLFHTKVMDNSMTWYNNQNEREIGRMGGDTRWTNEREGETEKDAFSKKSCYIQKMKTNNGAFPKT